jgi:hypothetical protein
MNAFPYRPTLAGLCLIAALVSVRPASAGKPTAATPDLSGTWQLNEDLSQTPQQSMHQGPEGAPPEGRGGGAGRRGGRFPGGGGGGRRPEGGGPPDRRADFEAAEKTMTIVWAAPQLTITYPGGRQRVLFTDGRKVKEERPDGKTVKTQASWTDTGSLEVVTKTDHGTRTEIYEITNDGRRLFVLIGFEGRGPRQFRRAYDRG